MGVAFGISSSSSLPALASFCGYASISIFFLWLFAATFFSACMVLDERRQRDNRRECCVCLTRTSPLEEDENSKFEEDLMSRYFRNYHAPMILSSAGKQIVLVIFAALVGFGIYGVMNLSVEDSTRAFIPSGSYIQDYLDASDEFYPEQGIDLFMVFEGSSDIYAERDNLATLATRLEGLEDAPPYIAEPVSEEAYKNVMAGYLSYLNSMNETWPESESEFVDSMKSFTSGPGAMYSTRDLLASWTDLQPVFPYSPNFIIIEGFKIIRRELFLNTGLALLSVGVIVFVTVASPVTSFLITFCVGCCIIEILGFMMALGIVIDSVSVINIVLAVGLSVDYSAQVGHCFMVKGGDDKNRRALEALADIGAAVLSGAISTFLAVVVLLFSSSYVFEVLSKQFAITVGLGVVHGLVLLPVLLSLFGPKAYTAADATAVATKDAADTSEDEHTGDVTGGASGARSDDEEI